MNEWQDKYAAGIVHVYRLFGEVGIEGRVELPKIVGTCNGCLVVIDTTCPACERSVLGSLEWARYGLEELTVADIEQCRLDAIHRHLNDGCDAKPERLGADRMDDLKSLLKKIREACPSARVNSVSPVEGHPDLVSVGFTADELVPIIEDIVPPLAPPGFFESLAGDEPKQET